MLILDTAATRGYIQAGPPFLVARGVGDSAWNRYAAAHWSDWVRTGDSLRVVVGKLGWQLLAREHDDSLSGRVAVISDEANLDFPSAPVWASRVPCNGM